MVERHGIIHSRQCTLYTIFFLFYYYVHRRQVDRPSSLLYSYCSCNVSALIRFNAFDRWVNNIAKTKAYNLFDNFNFMWNYNMLVC